MKLSDHFLGLIESLKIQLVDTFWCFQDILSSKPPSPFSNY